MHTLKINTKKGVLIAALNEGQVFVSLASLAQMKGVDVVQAERDIIRLSKHNPQENIDAAITQSNIKDVENNIRLKDEALDGLASALNFTKSQLRKKQEPQAQAELLALRIKQEKQIEEVETELQSLNTRAEQLHEAYKTFDVFNESVSIKNLSDLL